MGNHLKINSFNKYFEIYKSYYFSFLMIKIYEINLKLLWIIKKKEYLCEPIL